MTLEEVQVDGKLREQLIQWRLNSSMTEEVLLTRDGHSIRLRHQGPMTENIMMAVFIDGRGWSWHKSHFLLGLDDTDWLNHLYSEIDMNIAAGTK